MKGWTWQGPSSHVTYRQAELEQTLHAALQPAEAGSTVNKRVENSTRKRTASLQRVEWSPRPSQEQREDQNATPKLF